MSQGDVVVSAGKAITRAVCIGGTPFLRDLAKSPEVFVCRSHCGFHAKDVYSNIHSVKWT